jgi:hypothetical protein
MAIKKDVKKSRGTRETPTRAFLSGYLFVRIRGILRKVAIVPRKSSASPYISRERLAGFLLQDVSGQVYPYIRVAILVANRIAEPGVENAEDVLVEVRGPAVVIAAHRRLVRESGPAGKEMPQRHLPLGAILISTADPIFVNYPAILWI